MRPLGPAVIMAVIFAGGALSLAGVWMGPSWLERVTAPSPRATADARPTSDKAAKPRAEASPDLVAAMLRAAKAPKPRGEPKPPQHLAARAAADDALSEDVNVEAAFMGAATRFTAAPKPKAADQTAQAKPAPLDVGALWFDGDGALVVEGRANPLLTIAADIDGARGPSAEADAFGDFALALDAAQFAPPIEEGSAGVEPRISPAQRVTLSAWSPEGVLVAEATVLIATVQPAEQLAAGLSSEENAVGADAETMAAAAEPPAWEVAEVSGAPLADGAISIDRVRYAADGAPMVSGRGGAGQAVRLLLNGAQVAAAPVAADGRWRSRLPLDVAPGRYTLRAEQVSADGVVTAQADTPFERASGAEVAAAHGTVVVQPGNSLWVIADALYGSGERYNVIFKANAAVISDPNLIYPGQILTLPSPATARQDG